MNEIKSFETTTKTEICGTLLGAYRESKNAGNELINFYEVIWEREIELIAKNLIEEGVKEFTISTTFSSLLETLATFERFGFKVNGLTQVFDRYEDIFTGNRNLIPAIRMVLA